MYRIEVDIVDFIRKWQEDAFLRLFPSLKGRFTSPLRNDDDRPGCFFWYSKDRILYFVDFADYPTHRNVLKFYKDYYGVDTRKAIEIISNGTVYSSEVKERNRKAVLKQVKKSTKISVVRRDWLDIDADYWGQYQITIDDIKPYIFPIKSFTVKRYKSIVYLAYAIPIDKCVKIYMPSYKNQKKKFISNCRKTNVFGLKDIDFDKPVYVTKAFKDWIVLKKAGIDNLIVAQSESMGLPQKVIDKIQKAYILFDNDEAGIMYAEKLKKKFKDAEIILPECKDYADMATIFELSYIKNYIYEYTRKD